MALPGLVAVKNLADVADKERAWDNLGQEFTATFDTLPLALAPGTPLEGGYFAGYISHTADGNPTHALIVAPRATGATGTGYTLTTMLQWKTALTITASTSSAFDGAANTAALVAAGINDHPAAKFCTELTIGGFTDWYLPARFELDIAYFNLKPDTTANLTSQGINAYSVPKRLTNYTTTYPAQTGITAFNTSAEAFVADWHWSSTQNSGGSIQDSENLAWIARFNTGWLLSNSKTNTFRVRAFRRIAL
jgi:hypothetical protein